MRNNWHTFTAKITPLEKAFRPKIVRIIKDFREAFISDLKEHGHNTAVSNLQMISFADRLTPLIQSIYKTAGLTGARMQAQEIRKFVKEGEKAGGFGRNERWIADVINYLKIHMLGFIQDITDTMRADLIKIFERGINDNLTIPEIVVELRNTGLIESRARVIARTEIVRAANVGHAVAAKSFPYEVDKKWSAANDERNRPGHRNVHNHTVGENDFFKVPVYKGKTLIGSEEMLYPGDANASAGNTVNCRCRVLYIPKRDTAGNLIMRDRNQAPVIPMRRPQEYTPAQIAAILKANIFVGVQK